MQKLQEEKKRLESNNEILKEQNKILNEQMMKKSEKIKENGVPACILYAFLRLVLSGKFVFLTRETNAVFLSMKL